MSKIEIKEQLTAIRTIDVELDEETAAEVAEELKVILDIPFPGYQHVIAFLESKGIKYTLPDVAEYLQLDRIDVR